MYTTHDWRARALCADFRVLDEWTVPVTVPAGELPAFVQVLVASLLAPDSRIARGLIRLRLVLGRWFGWDEGPPIAIPGCAETTLTARLDDADRRRDQSAAIALPVVATSSPARVVYAFDDEALLEVSNRTIHAAIHVGRDASGAIGLTVLVKSRGWSSRAYLALIAPFRHAFVYPAWFRAIRSAWRGHQEAIAS